MKDSTNGRGFVDSGLPTKNEIISKEEGVNRRAVRAKGNAREVVGLELFTKAK